jgi:hypothetical protein
MTRFDCEATRDLLPLLVRDELTPSQASALTLHAEGCADCTADAAVIRLLHRTAPVAPPALEARVVQAVRRAPRRWAPARLAMAATVAAAVIGGTLALQRTSLDLTAPATNVIVLDDSVPVMSWAVADDPMLRGGTTLQQLSLEELELILAELDS